MRNVSAALLLALLAAAPSARAQTASATDAQIAAAQVKLDEIKDSRAGRLGAAFDASESAKDGFRKWAAAETRYGALIIECGYDDGSILVKGLAEEKVGDKTAGRKGRKAYRRVSRLEFRIPFSEIEIKGFGNIAASSGTLVDLWMRRFLKDNRGLVGFADPMSEMKLDDKQLKSALLRAYQRNRETPVP